MTKEELLKELDGHVWNRTDYEDGIMYEKIINYINNHFPINKEEVKYLVENIQHEYLSKETYYFARDLFNRMEKFLKETEQ